MTSQVREVPASFDAFYNEYDEYVESAIRKISRGYVRPDDVEDLKQQIYFRIVEKDYLTLAAKRIQERGEGSFTTYLFALIRSVLSNRFDKNTRNPLNMAIGVIETAPEGREETAALVLETYQDMVEEGFEDQMVISDYLDAFENFIGQMSEPWGPPIQFPDGSSHRKSLQLVYRLLRQDWLPPEIAKVLHVTNGSVFGYVKKLKALGEQFQSSR
jgi:DNA-directed RNA polymerase specialized sigma24 family protein